MSVESEITRIKNAVNNAYTKVSENGGQNVTTANRKIDGLGSAIATMPISTKVYTQSVTVSNNTSDLLISGISNIYSILHSNYGNNRTRIIAISSSWGVSVASLDKTIHYVPLIISENFVVSDTNKVDRDIKTTFVHNYLSSSNIAQQVFNSSQSSTMIFKIVDGKLYISSSNYSTYRLRTGELTVYITQ